MEILPNTSSEYSPVKVVVRADTDSNSSSSEAETAIRGTKKLTWRRRKDKPREHPEDTRTSLELKEDKKKTLRLKPKKRAEKQKQRKKKEPVDDLEPKFVDALDDSWDDAEAVSSDEADDGWELEDGEEENKGDTAVQPATTLHRWKSAGWYMDEMTDALHPKPQEKTAKQRSQRKSDPHVTSASRPGFPSSPSTTNRWSRTGLRRISFKAGKRDYMPSASLEMPEDEAEAMGQAIAQMQHVNSISRQGRGDKVEVKRSSRTTASAGVSSLLDSNSLSRRASEMGGTPMPATGSFTHSRDVGSLSKVGKPARHRTSTWAVLKTALFAPPDYTAGRRGAWLGVGRDAKHNVVDSDDSTSDNVSEDDASSPPERQPRLTEFFPKARMKIDNESWLYRKFSKAVIKWEKLKMKNLNPVRRDAATFLSSGGAVHQAEPAVPINVQLVHFGDYELSSDLDKGVALVAASKRTRTPQDLEGKLVCFQLLSTEDRLEDEGQSMSSIYCVVIGDRDKKFTTQTKPSAQILEWGETFMYHAEELQSRGWTLLVQVWGQQSRFFGEAEISLKDFSEQLAELPSVAPVCSAPLTAENQAGRQVTGKVSFAIWLTPIRWWDSPLEQLKLPEDSGRGSHRTSLWLPSDIPRPFPFVLHMPGGTLYEEPLVTFLCLKIVKVRAQSSPRAVPKVEHPKRPQSLQTGHSRRRGMLKNMPSLKIAAAKSRLWPGRPSAVGSLAMSVRSDFSVGSSLDFLDDFNAGDELAGEASPLGGGKPGPGNDEADPAGSGAGDGGGGIGGGSGGGGIADNQERETYEMMVSLRAVSKRFRFRGLKNLEDFATVNASLVFPITNHLHEDEMIRVQIRKRKGRRLVADTRIGVQALLDSIERVSGFGSCEPTKLTWRLDGRWPGPDSATGEAMLEYGASNSDHRGGLASTDTLAPDLTLYGRGMELERQQGSRQLDTQRSTFARISWLPFQTAKPAEEPETLNQPQTVGPLGFVKIVVHGVRLPVVQDCYFLLQTSNYWIRSRQAILRPQPSWDNMGFVLPLWVPDEKVIFAVFSATMGIRNTPALIGKCRYRISSMAYNTEVCSSAAAATVAEAMAPIKFALVLIVSLSN